MEVDLVPDPKANTLTVSLRHLAQAAYDDVVSRLVKNPG